MCNRLYYLLLSIATRKGLIFSFITTLFLGFILFSIPFGNAQLKIITGDFGAINYMLFFTPDQAFINLALLGDMGQSFYLNMLLISFIFPLAYVSFLSISLFFLFLSKIKSTKILQLICLLPLLAGIAEYIENIAMLIQLSKFPQKSIVLYAASGANIIQNSFLFLSLLLIGLSFFFPKKPNPYTNEIHN